MHQQQPISFETGGAFLRIKTQPLDRAGQIVSQEREFEPSGIHVETLAGHMAAAQPVLDLVVQMFDGASLLPVPVQQPVAAILQVGEHRMVAAIAAVGEQVALGLEQA